MRRRFSIYASLLLATLSLGACGGGDGEITGSNNSSISINAGSAALTVARGEQVTATVALTRTNFSGAVTLGTQNLPVGVSVVFAPATVSSGAVTASAALTVATTATPGTYTFSLTASGSGVSTATFPVTLTIPTPSITATALPTANIVQGQTATIPITITRAGGYADAVTLAISGLPAGVTHGFTPTSIAAGSTTSTLTLTAAAGASIGTTPITITASGTGVTAQTATVNLTVLAAAAPTITLAAAPAAVSVQAGQNATTTITLTRGGGFAGDVALAVSGAPANTGTGLSSTTLTGAGTTSTLTFTVGANTAPGQYNVTVTGTGTGVANATAVVALTVTEAPGVTLTAINAQTMSPGSSSPTPIAIIVTRTGGFAGNPTMSLEAGTSGVTATFTPNPVTGPSTQMTLTVPLGTAPGVYPMTVRATTGATSSTVSFNLTVVPLNAQSYALASIPNATSVQAGQTSITNVQIGRNTGFTGAVTLTLTGLPTGATYNFVPSVATGSASQLGIDVAANTAPGVYNLVIRGNSPGLAEVTTPLTLTISAPPGGAGNVTWEFCDAARFPVWFAVQNGTGGAWTPVTGTTVSGKRRFSFTITTQGGVAYAIPRSGGGTDVSVNYGTAAEQNNSGAQECTDNRARVNLTGSVAGLTQTPPFVSQSASVNVGDASATVGANGTFDLLGAPSGTSDLLAVRTTTTIGGGGGFTLVPDRAILRRSTNYTTSIPALDFATEGFAPTSAQITVGNLGGDQLEGAYSLFQTSRGDAGSFTSLSASLTSPVTVYGVPNAQLQAGDLHGVIVSAASGTAPTQSRRTVFQYNQQLIARTITLGPAMTLPTITTNAAPYRRFNATGPWQAEYADAVGVLFYDQAASGDTWTLTMSRAYAGAGATTWTLDMPDFSAVAGFNTAWALSLNINWSATVSSLSGFVNSQVAEGAQLRTASRTGTATP